MDPVLEKCNALIPTEILTKISACYRRSVAPRPRITVFGELRTAEPIVDNSIYGMIGHIYSVTAASGAEIMVSVLISMVTRNPTNIYVDTCGVRIAQMNIPQDGCGGYLFVNNRIKGSIFEEVAAAYIVGKRYNFDLMACRLRWANATRKQKSVRKLLIDQQPQA
jgi:hypothetical protein